MNHRNDIDGLRAFAVLPVLFFHVGWGFPGGFVGVDVFFVISGFLISGILIRELETDRFSIIRFFDRRVRRILPAFSFMLLGVVFAAWWLYLPFEFEKLGKHLTDVSILLSNYWLEERASDYWSPRAEELPLLHTWSLAVEEQFYIFMPVLLWLMFRFFKKKIEIIVVFLFLTSFSFCIIETNFNPSSAFYLLPSRAWQLLLGTLTYLLSRKIAETDLTVVREIASGAVLVMLFVSFFLISEEQKFPGYIALIPTSAAAILILANSGRTTYSGCFLAWFPFVSIGLISYSLYLWHWPTIVFVKTWRYPNDVTTTDEIVVVIISLVFAVISWRFIEQPFRENRFRNTSGRAVLVGLAVLMFWLAISLVIRKTDGYPERFEKRVEEYLFNVVKSDVLNRDGSGRFQAQSIFSVGGLQQDVMPNEYPSYVMIGDSHGAMFAPVVANVLAASSTPSAFFTHDGITPLFGDDETSNAAVRRFVDKWKPERILVILRWDNVISEGVSQIEEIHKEKIKRYAETFKWLSWRTCHLQVGLQIPRISEDNTRAARIVFSSAIKNDGNLPEIRNSVEDRLLRNDTIEFLEGLEIENLEILDLSEPYLEGGYVSYHDNGLLYYRDDDHLNLRGASLARQFFTKDLASCEGR